MYEGGIFVDIIKENIHRSQMIKLTICRLYLNLILRECEMFIWIYVFTFFPQC